MTNVITKHLMAYSLLVVGYLIVRKYIKVTSDNLSTSTTTGTIAEDTASAIVALAERIEYLNSHAVHIPDTDSEAEEEVKAWISKAKVELETLVRKYIKEKNLRPEGKDVLEVVDRRGRGVRLYLRNMNMAESPDMISYKKQLEDLKSTNWEKESENIRKRRMGL